MTAATIFTWTRVHIRSIIQRRTEEGQLRRSDVDDMMSGTRQYPSSGGEATKLKCQVCDRSVTLVLMYPLLA